MQFAIHFETLGSKFDAPIVTLVAQGFDPAKCVVLKDKAFYQEIDLSSAMKAGTADASMLELWAKRFVKRQPGPGVAKPTKMDLASALMNFSEYIAGSGSTRVWFDTTIVEPATLLWNFKFGGVGLQPRWFRSDVRDMETLIEASGVARAEVKNMATTPQMIAEWNATMICACLAKLKGKKPAPPVVDDDDEL